jgi:thiamine pyridinylase
MVRILVLVSCFFSAILYGQNSSSPKNDHLRVALFPYIPDSAGDGFYTFTRRITDEFEKIHPGVRLDIRPLSTSDDLYDIDQLAKWLTGEPSEGGYHIVEVDAVILRELMAKKVLKAWPKAQTQPDFHSAAIAAVTFPEGVMGLPHWLCGHFLFSRNRTVAAATSISLLVSALERLGTPMPNLAADLLGSFNLPSIYLDAWADRKGADSVADGLSPELDEKVISDLKSFAKQCSTGSSNPCLDGTFDDNWGPVIEFADKRADSVFGYSERLHFIRKRMRQLGSTESIYLQSAPLGDGSSPLLFVDALVLRADCDARCDTLAQAFGDYLIDARTFGWMLSSEDAGRDAIPRYLIPATRTAFAEPRLSKDRYYQAIRAAIADAKPFPNGGLYDIRRKMRDAILAALK